MRNLGNVEIAVFEQQKHGHRWGAMLSRAPAGGLVILSSAAWGRISASFPRFFGTLGAMTERARPVIGTFGAKLAAIFSIF